MANGRNLINRKPASTPGKRLKHPYAAIEHRVIDSPAYADLSFSAQALLLLLARQLTKDNNGQLQATYTYCARHGFGSEHTLRTAIGSLIAHGFIYRTRSHGANHAWARYAVTWLPIGKDREGLFLDGFLSCAWQRWTPSSTDSKKKSAPKKMPHQSGKKCSFTPEFPAKNAEIREAKNADYELMPCSVHKQGATEGTSAASETGSTAWTARVMHPTSAEVLAMKAPTGTVLRGMFRDLRRLLSRPSIASRHSVREVA